MSFLKVSSSQMLVRVGLVLCFTVGLFARPEPAAATGPYGVYPDCIAPAVPLEVHSWWQQDTDPVPRHIHIGACLPNARDLTAIYTVQDRVHSVSDRVTKIETEADKVWRKKLSQLDGKVTDDIPKSVESLKERIDQISR